MKTFISLFIFLSFFFNLTAQSLDWHKVFEIHSLGGGASISPVSAKSDNNTVFVTVVEAGILKIHKYAENGTLEGVLNTEFRSDKYTPLTRLGNGNFAMMFRKDIVTDEIYLFQFDADLNIIKLDLMDFMVSFTIADPLKLFEVNGILFCTIFNNNDHMLFRIDENVALTPIYSGEIEIAFGDNLIVLDNGNIVFSFLTNNKHLVRCVSPVQGNILWEHTSDLPYWQLREYYVFNTGEELLKISLDVVWEGSNAIGTIRVIKLDSMTGEVIDESILFPDNICAYSFFDLIYNENNGNVYMAYYNSCGDSYINLLEFDPDIAEPVNSVSFDFTNDQLNIGQPAYLSVLDNGKVNFIYKSYANENEQGNIYVVKLNPDLSENTRLELNFNPPNGSEHITHILPVENSKFLITGVIPDNDPNIFWEQVKYFTAMINLDGNMSVDTHIENGFELQLYPNPATHTIKLLIPDAQIYSGKIYNALGQITYQTNHTIVKSVEIDISNLEPGIYYLNLYNKTKSFTKRFIVKK